MKAALTSRDALLTYAIFAMTAVIAYRFPAFITPNSLANTFNDTAPLMILVIGQMIVILTKCIDLSVAVTLALTGMISGLLAWRVGIASTVVTLCTMTIYRGIIFLMTDGKWVIAHKMSDAFRALPRLHILVLPMMSWIALAVIAVFGAIMTRRVLGRTQFAAFTISGALAGMVGYLLVSRYAVAYVDVAGGFELGVNAACVISGISIAGGIGGVRGAILGTAIVLAVAVNALQNRPTGRLILNSAETGARA